MGRVASLAAAGLLATTVAAAPRPTIPNVFKRQNDTTESLTFLNVTASTELEWVDCYQANYTNLQCAFLAVPLDYEDEEAGTTNIAFARYFVSEDLEDLLLNPGGPAESGIDFVISSGEEYYGKWNMNIVSFDPRGVSLSGPKVRCSYDTGNSTTLKRRQEEAPPNSLKASWDSNLETNTACNDANKDSKAKYVGTAAVVQDMMHYVELQAALRGKDPKTAEINFYGISYGTAVGQTLVAMYPDRLRRVLVDGNVYSVAHYQGWEPTGIDDFAYGIFMFAKLCFEAGPEWCQLAEGMHSIEEVHERFDNAIQKLNSNPVQTQDGTTWDGNTFIGKIQGWMYFPRGADGGYPDIVNATLAVENDDIEAVLGTSVNEKRGEPELVNALDPTYSKSDMLTIITAVDIAGRFPWKTYESWKAATLRLVSTAPYNAVGYSTTNGLIGLAMDNLVPPPSQFFEGFEHVNTSAPVLFINTPGDPVTPRSSAYNMQRLFAGSGVLIHNSPGHGYSNAPSKCTDDVVAAYFADATLPEEGKWCEPDVEANYYFGGPDPTKEEETE